ncbi:hypothetical protein TVAG_083740 [Trichomonas vaginalis G3]|uniref:BZIP domain-containing protein n=1 Tax=Trichomonas vaginalis (strain ATCC PRA-98 / G3) TaxID=412133 RepID=A2DM99_TRIV3|nr:leucine zipper domain family [Trichomonas vaginalis G3]EAY18519.1 hypothetical protein TVAG_083740 [Trichomonas vaginalis G3]KAI5489491.1 leucine zipper domain family [Trichomonas vaginalis G3]|eukprot:XP_001579505.1 hypothetical protein [Trichomonas vaginalis G3]
MNPIGIVVPEKQPVYPNPQQEDDESSDDDHISKHSKVDKEELKARNRKAAKKWRDKKDSTLHQLAETNDDLRKQALKLRSESLSLIAENRVLESELRFFQTFMTKIMGTNQKK